MRYIFWTSFVLMLLAQIGSVPYSVDVIASRKDPYITGFFVVVYVLWTALTLAALWSWKQENERHSNGQ